MKLKKVYSPITIRGKRIRNRIVLAPMGTRSSALDGSLTDRCATYLEERAKGGAGMILPELTSVREGYSWIPSLQVYNDKLIPALSRLADSVHSFGSVVIMQLALHGGRAPRSITGKPCIAPSSIDTKLYKETPEELSENEIYAIIDDFTSAAWRVKRAGFDGVEVHGSHGYLINEFISPHTNHRNDKWGGSLENRLRFAEYIIKSIREKCGNDFIIGFKFSAYEQLEGGVDVEEGVRIAEYIQDKGIDYIHVSATSSTIPGHSYCEYPSVPSMYDPSNTLVPLAQRVKEVVKIPVIAAGAISDIDDAEEILSSDNADMVAVGRAFLADPYWGLNPQINKNSRPCMRCNHCHINVILGKDTACAINPGLLREYRDLNSVKTDKAQKVLIIGGGPAGIETALQAKAKGHEVAIYEKSTQLGGALRLASIPEFKTRARKLLEYYMKEIEDSEVRVVTSQVINEDNIKQIIDKENPDVVVLSTGGTPFVPRIEGTDKCYQATDVIENADKYELGNKVVIIGGGKVGLELAWMLSDMGKDVKVLEMITNDKLMAEDHPTTRATLLHKMEERNIKIIDGCRVQKIDENIVSFVLSDGSSKTVEVDSTILSAGFRGDSKLYELLENIGYEKRIYEIGDCKQARGMFEAIHEGYYLGRYMI